MESKNIDLACVLGSRENELELKELLGVIKEVDFDNVPQEMVGYTNEETPDGSRKPAPKSPGGQNNPKGSCDFIWYDPWEKKEATREEVLEIRKIPRVAPPNQVYGYTYVDQNGEVADIWNIHQNVNVCDEVEGQRGIVNPFGEPRADTTSRRDYESDRDNRAGERMSVDTPGGKNHRFLRGRRDDDLDILPVSEGRSQMRTLPRSPANTAPVVSYRADTPPRSPSPPRRTNSSLETAIGNFLRGAQFARGDMKLDIIALQALVRDLVRDACNYRSQKSAISKCGR